MSLEWLVVILVFAVLIVTLIADAGSAKKKHSDYFKKVQKPTGKAEREAVIPDPNTYNKFFANLNH